MNILVTGGSGFIGSHTCLNLLEKGYFLTILDSNINSSYKSILRFSKILKGGKDLFKNFIFEKGDIRDELFLKNVFTNATKQNKKIDAVIHFAGLKAVAESVINPIKYWENNVVGTLNLLKEMKLHNCKNIVFSSSATVYGNSSPTPFFESYSIDPTNPYGNTKATIEYMLEDFYRSSKEFLRVGILRYFNPIGAHDSGLLGEDPNGIPNNLFPYICKVAQKKYNHLSIFGNDWPTKDGTCVRDYIHIMDLADAHSCTLEYLIKENPQIVKLNIGSGSGTSVLELVQKFIEVNKFDVPYKFCDRRKGDVSTIVASNEKAISLLNWYPKKNLEDMCRDGWKWQRMNPNGYETKI